MNGTMKAGIYIQKGEFRLEERPIPQISSKDVLVKVARAGICSSEVFYYKMGAGPWLPSGNITGHEFVGTICEVGSEVSPDIKVGQRVFVEPVKGSPAEKNGIIGAMTEYVPVVNAKLNYNLFLLPDTLPFKDAVVLEPFCVALHGIVRADIKPDDKIVVMGAGPIGLMALAGLLDMGYKNVVATDVRPEAIEMIEKFGGVAINTKERDMKEALIEHFGAVENNMHEICPDVDVYLDYACAQGLCQQVVEMAKNNAKHILVAAYKWDTTYSFANMQKITCTNFEIRGSYTYSTETIQKAISILAPGNSIVPRVITHEFTLDNFFEGIRCAAEQDDSFKVVVNVSD